MCGIAGIAGRRDIVALRRMCELLQHRGPDDWGEYWDPDEDLGIAMQRLSILDLSGGHQSMTNEAANLWIVYNGEIFKSPQLRAELECRGHVFATTNSDTAVFIEGTNGARPSFSWESFDQGNGVPGSGRRV